MAVRLLRFLAQSVLVKSSDRRIDHRGRIEALQRGPLGFTIRAGWYSKNACFAATLRVCAGAFLPPNTCNDLPTEPAELVVVPHVDEGPAGARVL